MTIYNPINRSQTRSMNRGDSSVETFSAFKTMGDHAREALAERGYKQSGNPATGATQHLHPDGHSVTVYGGSAIVTPSNEGRKGSVTRHVSLHGSNGLHEALKRIHGDSGDAKLSVSAGAAMDPAVKKK